MAFSAVVFDLYGTLVPEFPRSAFYETVDRMAEILGADVAAFRDEWNATAIHRQTGQYPDGMPGNVRAICAAVGIGRPSDDEVTAALRPRADMYRRWFHPRDGALETVSAIREGGLPLALISMCAPDTPAMWLASPFAGLFAVEVFSSETGLRKPDPAIYASAYERLGVDPAACLYCGDGAYGELAGAEAVGMTAVEIRDPLIDVAEQLRPEGEDWAGRRVAHLDELLALL